MEIIRKAAEERLTLAPVYAPETTDRYGEWASAAELERAIFEFAKAAGRTVRLQHQDGTAVGQIESIFTWPYAVALPVYDGRGISKGTRQFRAGTAFAWIRWTPEAWEAVKRGAIRGLSIGGTARRIRVEADGAPALQKRTSEGWGRRLVSGERIAFG